MSQIKRPGGRKRKLLISLVEEVSKKQARNTPEFGGKKKKKTIFRDGPKAAQLKAPPLRCRFPNPFNHRWVVNLKIHSRPWLQHWVPPVGLGSAQRLWNQQLNPLKSLLSQRKRIIQFQAALSKVPQGTRTALTPGKKVDSLGKARALTCKSSVSETIAQFVNTTSLGGQRKPSRRLTAVSPKALS